MINKTELGNYKIGILIDETYPIGFMLKKEERLFFDENGDFKEGEEFANKVIEENRYNIIDLKTYFDRGGIEEIFKDSFYKLISEKGNINEYKNSYNIDFYIIIYKGEEKEIIDKIILDGFNKVLNKEIIQISNITLDKTNYNLSDDNLEYFEKDEREKFEILISLLNSRK